MGADYLAGVVEGYYGREWDWALRRQYAGFLKAQGLNTYLYCPKGDAFLRKRWQEPWPEGMRRELEKLAACYGEQGLYWGVGLSPFALYLDYGGSERAALRSRVEQINALGGSLLAILFDDMPGDCPDLAARQAEIVADIAAWTTASRLLVCPTYYSFDPVLERFFGAMPAHYWESLGAALDPGIDLFWTGNSVCSPAISCADISRIAGLMGRAPLLWDNYPVNDGERGSRFLNLAPLPGRDPDLGGVLRGHLCNPMNQGLLSRLPLLGLARLYGRETGDLESLVSADLAAQLHQDMADFQSLGLDEMGEKRCLELAARYDEFDDPAASEVSAWLKGEYTFDPACLTG